VLVEVISGESIDELGEDELPEDLMACQDDELRHMGLALLRKVAANVRHLEISGVTYLSFTMPLPAPARG
jgi:hypothetical protein